MSLSSPIAWPSRALRDVGANLVFFTRLPLPFPTDEAPNWPAIAWAAPLAGAIVGIIGGVTALGAVALGLPLWICATLGIAALALATGALHEDGLADVADSFGGGSTRERKLEIMRDSRIGVYGATALTIGMLLRIEAVSTMLSPGRGMGSIFAFAALALSGAAARCGALAMLCWLPPARADGAGASAIGLKAGHLTPPTATLTLIAVVTGLAALEPIRALFACVLAAGAVWGLRGAALRHIGGQTGDVCGAAAMICEISVLCALLIGVR